MSDMFFCHQCRDFKRFNILGHCTSCASLNKYPRSNEFYNLHKDDPDVRSLFIRALDSVASSKAELTANITSSDTISGKRIVKNLGMVSATQDCVVMFSGTPDMKWATDRATEKMKKQAFDKKANAIVSVRTHSTRQGFNLLVTVSGTAVQVEDDTSSDNPNYNDAPNISPADEIKKYKELLDIGAISNEEFEAKKKQLLGL